MTPLALFFRTLSRTSAICLGAALAVLQPPLDWTATQSMTTAAAPAPRPQATIQELSRQLTASDPAVRARAACDLREHAHRAIDPLIPLMKDPRPPCEGPHGRSAHWMTRRRCPH